MTDRPRTPTPLKYTSINQQQTLVNSNSAFIASIVRKYYLSGVDATDLFQEGVAGFLKYVSVVGRRCLFIHPPNDSPIHPPTDSPIPTNQPYLSPNPTQPQGGVCL